MLPGTSRIVAVLAAALALTTSPALAAPWSPVTGTTGITQQVGQARGADGALHAVWVAPTAAGAATSDVHEIAIAADGTVGTPSTVARSFASASNPAIVATPAGLQVLFGGIQCTDPSCAEGLFSSTSADGGLTWSAPASLFDRDQNYASDVNAATLSDGTPFQTWWHTTGVSVHRGVDPATADTDFQAGLGAGCCGYYSNFAADAAGHLQLAWDSNATGFLGVYSQAVDPATGAPSGTPLLMPGSVTDGNHAQMGSRTPIASTGGAFFVAYPAGYPSVTKVLLWQVGSAAPTTVVDDGGVHNEVALAADGTGGLWVFWTGSTDAGGPAVFARRVSSAGLEPIVEMGAPDNAAAIYALDGAVSAAGEPEALALTGFPDNTSGTYYTRGGSVAAPPAPVLGKAVNVTPVSGNVYIHIPGKTRAAVQKGQDFVPLAEARQLPVGTQIDARKGVLDLVAAAPAANTTQTARLSGGLFSLTQSRKGLTKGLTTFKLLEGLFPGAPTYKGCGSRAATTSAHAAKLSRKVLQTLHASDKHGRFRTRGKFSAATVRGTKWDTVDRCDGTLTVVKRGSVRVADFGRRRTITVRAGHHYLAQR